MNCEGRRKDAALDVSVVNPLQQQLAGQVAREGANGVQHAFNIKMGKYSERCKAEGIVFIPLVVGRFGKWYKDAVEVITQAGEAHGEGGGGDNNEERMEQLLQRVVNCGARQCEFSWRI